jgi:hypothetical protein
MPIAWYELDRSRPMQVSSDAPDQLFRAIYAHHRLATTARCRFRSHLDSERKRTALDHQKRLSWLNFVSMLLGMIKQWANMLLQLEPGRSQHISKALLASRPDMNSFSSWADRRHDRISCACLFRVFSLLPCARGRGRPLQISPFCPQICSRS